MPTQSRKTILLATDQQRSVLNALDANLAHASAYTPYGHRPLSGLLSLLGFNGQPMDLLTGNYHLGNGYRPFSPVLMRFICPDSLSPFGKGGLNAYAYCGGDPRNRVDPTGRSFMALLQFFRPSNSLAKTVNAGNKAAKTAGELANMKRGMSYKGKILGYQLGEPSSNLKLDRKSVDKIENYTRIIKEKNNELTDMATSMLDAIPDPAVKQATKDKLYGTFIYPTVENPSTPRDIAVFNLHNQVMNFENNKNIVLHLQSIKGPAPAALNSEIRQLTN